MELRMSMSMAVAGVAPSMWKWKDMLGLFLFICQRPISQVVENEAAPFAPSLFQILVLSAPTTLELITLQASCAPSRFHFSLALLIE